jgi:hypothetical protein
VRSDICLVASGARCVIQPVSSWTSSPGPRSATGIVVAVPPTPSSAIAKRRRVA